MKKRLHAFFIRFLAVLLSIVMLGYTPLNVFAAEGTTKTLYIKDIKLIYAESKSEAQSYVPAGYTLLEYDLNKGTEYVFDVYEVYLAYSTTEDPNEAITDIKMMNMNGGFVLSDYEEQLQNVKENVKALADDLKSAVSMFAKNYAKGTYGAKAAYRALNAFTVDEANGQGLADYFLYGNPTDAFYVKAREFSFGSSEKTARDEEIYFASLERIEILREAKPIAFGKYTFTAKTCELVFTYDNGKTLALPVKDDIYAEEIAETLLRVAGKEV